MKKIVIGIVVVVSILIAVCFGLRTAVNSKISSKIEELNNNGFKVTYNSSALPLKVKGNGEVQVIDALKVLEYLISKQDDESELKETVKSLLDIFEPAVKQKSLEGISFEYDFELNVITSNLDLNVFLTKLSTVVMYELLNSQDEVSKSILNLLNSKEIKINIDEDSNYKLSDISFGNSGALTSIRGVTGDKNNLNIGLFKVVGADNESFIIEDIKSFYSEKNKNIDSKLSISNISMDDMSLNIKLKNLILDSNSIYEKDMLKGTNKISFEEFLLNKKSDYMTFDPIKNIDLKNTQIEFTADKIPYKKYKELIKALEEGDNEVFAKKFDEFFNELLKNEISITSKGEATTYKIGEDKIFDKLKYEAIFNLNKNISLTKLENLKDIFEKIEIKVDLDKDSASKIVELSKGIKDFSFVDFNDPNFKRFTLELKDGVYVNGVKILEEKDLDFKTDDFSDYNDSAFLENYDNLNYSYELINKNLVRVSFKYKTGLSSVSSGGISVSFPQIKDASKIKAHSSKTFKKLDFYNAKDSIFSGMLDKNITAEYLMVEGWDDKWSDKGIEKEFSLDVDITGIDDFLEINLRGYSTPDSSDTSSIAYEILPNEIQSYTLDQQSYPVRIADIDISALREGN